ncbi:LOW QUALITY PROTEIN: hypothetical protein YC2023_099429 [Brassica napus]
MKSQTDPKTNPNAVFSIFSRSSLSNSQPLVADADASFCDFGLNGIVYNREGYLLLVLVVRATHGKCRRINREGEDCVAEWRSGCGRWDVEETERDTVVVVSQKNLWFVDFFRAKIIWISKIRRRVDPDCKPDRCETNYASFKVFSEHLARKKNLIRSWGWVLRRGTEHFSAEFSQFCDRKMSDVVSMLCWNRVWPKPLYR